jgi:hypothetical protein
MYNANVVTISRGNKKPTIQISKIIFSTEAEGLRELALHVVLPKLVKG